MARRASSSPSRTVRPVLPSGAVPPGPIRTCVGCRERAPVADLVRVVVLDQLVVPDPARSFPGRGASLHPCSGCFELAERRRAFGRALRTGGVPLDLSVLRAFVAAPSPRAGARPHTEEK
jgi:predicted RNA-binding protein YlxR (DUF448 family)